MAFDESFFVKILPSAVSISIVQIAVNKRLEFRSAIKGEVYLMIEIA